MDKRSEKKMEDETAGGFNPDRPSQSPKQTVGPLPTDDPRGQAGADLKTELKKQAKGEK